MPNFDSEIEDRIHTLWDELAAFEAAQSEDALNHLLTTVGGLVNAQNAYWFAAVRMSDDPGDPLNGWRPRGLRYLQPLVNDATFTRDRIKSIDRGTIDESTVAQARQAGSYRANRLCDLVSPQWFDGPFYQGYLERGVHDSLVVGAPVGASAESYYGFLKTRPADPFSESDRQIALYSMRGLSWFHRQVLLAHGFLVAKSPPSPLERRVMALLLTNQSEKSIAASLDLSPSSVHTYVRDIFRKFGVSGRKGLTAVWLGRQS